MTITANDILIDCVQRIRKRPDAVVADITRELLAVLLDISERGDFLAANRIVPVAAGVRGLHWPSGCKRISRIQHKGGEELEYMAWGDFLARAGRNDPKPYPIPVSEWTIENWPYAHNQIDEIPDGATIDGGAGGMDLAGYEGRPTAWSVWREQFFVDPVPEREYDLDVYYYRRHPETTERIEYADRFRPLIVEGVMAKLWGGVLQIHDPQAVEYTMCTQTYERLLADLMTNISRPLGRVRYHDI